MTTFFLTFALFLTNQLATLAMVTCTMAFCLYYDLLAYWESRSADDSKLHLYMLLMAAWVHVDAYQHRAIYLPLNTPLIIMASLRRSPPTSPH